MFERRRRATGILTKFLLDFAFNAHAKVKPAAAAAAVGFKIVLPSMSYIALSRRQSLSFFFFFTVSSTQLDIVASYIRSTIYIHLHQLVTRSKRINVYILYKSIDITITIFKY